eukprot:scaffold46374_cov66-Phaeocystis_antarctica.AAC.2
MASRRFTAILPGACLGGLPFATNVSRVVDASTFVAHVTVLHLFRLFSPLLMKVRNVAVDPGAF